MSATVEPTNKKEPPRESWTPLVQRNMPLVKYVLGKLSGNLPPCVDRDDLLAAGTMGLIEAARKFDPSRNVPFHSYAIPRIWGAMLDELRRHDWLSTDTREQVSKLQRSMARLEQEGQRNPSVDLLARELGYPTKRVARLMSLARIEPKQSDIGTALLDAAGTGLYARVGTRPPRGPYEEIEFRDVKQALARAIERLPVREKKVIILRYHEGLYLHEIGEIMEVSESRVCQIHSQALRRLREALTRVGLTA